MPFTNDPKMTNRLFGLMSLILVLLYTMIVCAVITQDINPDSTERKYVNERRARTGLKWMSIPVLIAVVIANAYVIFTL
jgi:hypothetical protein